MTIKEAKKELLSKTEGEIETETAQKWEAFAVACYELSIDAKEIAEKVKWILRGDDNRHEALEHASLVEDNGKTVSFIQKTIAPYRKAAMQLEL